MARNLFIFKLVLSWKLEILEILEMIHVRGLENSKIFENTFILFLKKGRQLTTIAHPANGH